MSVDPLEIIGEILGEPASQMRNPVNADYLCPFINSECVKKSHSFNEPYPVCSIWAGREARGTRRLICACPKRFFEADIQQDVIKHCWKGEPPANPRVAYEIKMSHFGNVDFVIADIDPATNTVKEFISVELQAVDFTGSVVPAYLAVLNSEELQTRPKGGVNWANVRKRYISQVITKGFYHHQWGSRIVAVLQKENYEQMREYLRFDELSAQSDDANILFMLYEFFTAPDGTHHLQLDSVKGTSHSSLMMSQLYHRTPPRSEFCDRILSNLNRGVTPADDVVVEGAEGAIDDDDLPNDQPD